MRKEVEQNLARALAIAEDPATVFCVQPFASLENDGGDHLGRLLARVINDPARALLVATDNAFVFAFGDQLAGNQAPLAEEPKSH